MGNPSARRGRPDREADRTARSALLCACVVVLVISLGVLILAWIVWGCVGLKQPSARATAALTTVGGMGGSVFLVVKYRAQNLVEKQHAISRIDHDDELIDKALELFASDNSLKRATGARQLIELADKRDDLSCQQRIVDAFCASLRVSAAEGGSDGENADSAFVERGFVRAIRERLGGSNGSLPSWAKCVFDLGGVRFGSLVDLSDCTFEAEVDLRGASFVKGATFSNAVFEVAPVFSGACFQGDVTFDKCQFRSCGDLDFSCSVFKGGAGFVGTTFGGSVLFGHPRSYGGDEGESAGGDLGQDGASPFPTTFFSEADFSGAVFHGDARFGLGKCLEDSHPLLVARFDGPAHFEKSEFGGNAYFGSVVFGKGVYFNERRRGRGSSEGRRSQVAESSSSRKRGAVFRGSAYFHSAYFRTDGVNCLNFDYVDAAEVDFGECEFDGCNPDVRLRSANVSFRGARIMKPPSFKGAKVPCEKDKHKSVPIRFSWTGSRIGGVTLKEGEYGGIPEEAYCPQC